LSNNKGSEAKTNYWVFNFGIFNLYAKKNPIGYEFENQMSGQIKVYQHTLFTIVPNFSIKAEL